MSDPLQPRPDVSPVPVSYAEKTMASLLQLHSELMEEKERRVDLYRRLAEKDEALAELRYQVKLLEDRLRRAEGQAAESARPAPQPVQAEQAPQVSEATTAVPLPAAVQVARVPADSAQRPQRPNHPVARTVVRKEDWRQW